MNGAPVACPIRVMTRRESLTLLLTSPALTGLLPAGEAANLTGAWDLQVGKSEWGKKEKPVSAEVAIQHKEPQIEYKGTIISGPNGESRTFVFSGLIDGVARPYQNGQLTIRRADDRTTISEFKSTDGKTVETTRTTISRDGKSLTRRTYAQGPQGAMVWTEVYTRRP